MSYFSKMKSIFGTSNIRFCLIFFLNIRCENLLKTSRSIKDECFSITNLFLFINSMIASLNKKVSFKLFKNEFCSSSKRKLLHEAVRKYCISVAPHSGIVAFVCQAISSSCNGSKRCSLIGLCVIRCASSDLFVDREPC
jgi:hypothetical protein